MDIIILLGLNSTGLNGVTHIRKIERNAMLKPLNAGTSLMFAVNYYIIIML